MVGSSLNSCNSVVSPRLMFVCYTYINARLYSANCPFVVPTFTPPSLPMSLMTAQTFLLPWLFKPGEYSHYLLLFGSSLFSVTVNVLLYIAVDLLSICVNLQHVKLMADYDNKGTRKQTWFSPVPGKCPTHFTQALSLFVLPTIQSNVAIKT